MQRNACTVNKFVYLCVRLSKKARVPVKREDADFYFIRSYLATVAVPSLICMSAIAS